MSDDKNTTPTDGTPNDGNDGGSQGGKQDGDKNQSRTFTQEDVDKAVENRLAREREKFDKNLDERLTKERKEWDRQNKLSEDERTKELLQKEQKTIEAKNQELTIRENKLEGINKLNEFKIPIKFIDFVISADREEMMKNIENFNSEWSQAVAAEVENRLKGNTPKAPNGNSNGDTKKVVTTF